MSLCHFSLKKKKDLEELDMVMSALNPALGRQGRQISVSPVQLTPHSETLTQTKRHGPESAF